MSPNDPKFKFERIKNLIHNELDHIRYDMVSTKANIFRKIAHHCEVYADVIEADAEVDSEEE